MHPSMSVDTPPSLASTVVRRFDVVSFDVLSPCPAWEGVRQASALLLDTYRQTFGAFSRSNFYLFDALYDVFLNFSSA